jgi:hypothetical protein
MSKKTLAMCVAAAALFTLSLSASAADKLVVEDSAIPPNKMFSVTDTGDVNAAGNVTSDGYLGIGVATPKAAISAKGADSPSSQLMMLREETHVNGGAGFIAYHNNADTAMPNVNDRLGYFLFGSYFKDTTNKYGAGVDWLWARNGGGISARADGNWTDTSIPTYFTFETAGSGTTARTERLRIGSDGVIKINDLAGSYSGGSAYVCVNNSGELYASESACP